MKRNIMDTFSYTCISFTTVSVLMALAAYVGIQRYLFSAETLELLLVCFVLSLAQVVCNAIPAIESHNILRALINVGLLLGLGGGVLGWFGASPLAFAIGAGVSLLAYASVWVYADYKIRLDAKAINAVLQNRQKPSEE